MPDYLHEHEPLWAPSTTVPEVVQRRLATSSFTEHCRVVMYSLGAGGLFFASPNADHIAQPPAVGSSGSPQTYSDRRWGPLEWTRTPQLLREETEHHICTYQLLRPGSVDPPHALGNPRAHCMTPSDEALDDLHLSTATANDCAKYEWELNTFLFRANFERLTAFKHGTFNRAPLHTHPQLWVALRDRVRRVWGFGLNYFPSISEPAYLDSNDKLLRLRHWRALGHIMLEWEVPARHRERIHVAMGGTVTKIECLLTQVFKDLHA
ncbi:hypothetical protein FOMPIDRAFT_1053062 [Fomitopsis schrenkii]|uniref:Uncharacterized protein n=1 Tax=Fomitopsis schrenkii TaxID=2126942 RepID=S8DVR6_FOMSC|nr:hypothetical protein FOMPIDRAFT_1053062 [Fomitopsis schrenkii]